MKQVNGLNIVNHGFPKDLEVGVLDQAVTFIQHSDTMDEDRYQYLRVKAEAVDYDPKDNTDSFFRIATGDAFAYNDEKTDVAPFWSCMGPEELTDLFNEAARRMGMRCRWKCEKYFVDVDQPEVKLTDEQIEKIVADYKAKQEKEQEKIRKQMED